MKRVGIFLAYAPEVSIRKDGLGRLLAFFIKGAIERGDYGVAVACPNWSRQELNDLLDDHKIDPSKVDVITTASDPYVIRLRSWLQKRSTKPRRRLRSLLKGLLVRLRAQAVRSLMRAGASSTFGEAAAHVLRAAPPALFLAVIAVVALPFLLLRRLAWLLPAHFRAQLGAYWKVVRSPATAVTNLGWMQDFYAELRSQELGRLIRLMNAQSDIDGWLVPNLFWPEAKDIKARTVVVAPDIVLFEFPVHYGDQSSVNFLGHAEIVAERADHFITYSDFVRDEHLVRGLGVLRSKISVVRHGRVSMAEYLRLGSSEPSPALRREIALSIVDEYQGPYRQSGPSWARSDFENTPFLFYSSQLRHHKNIFMLIKVVEELNRKDGVDIRLLLTANLYANDRIVRYVNDRGLGNIILSAHDIPSKLMAAVASLATLAVTPTLFEGGFPFTFCEAYSVGTPSIMSDIPVTREVMDTLTPEIAARTLFSADNAASLKSKILWGVENRQSLFDLQAELYDSYPTWPEVAGRYLDIVAGDQFERTKTA